MTTKKGRPPLPETTATEQKQYNINSSSRRFRQQINILIVWLAVHGLVPITLAEWVIRRGGLAND
jgi:hypothetical protein